MLNKPLKGRKIAVLIESEFIPGEVAAYQSCFPLLGAEVHFVSRLWGQPSLTFVSDVETANTPPQTLEVKYDVAPGNPHHNSVGFGDYDAVLMAANYTSVKLRYDDMPAEGYTIDVIRKAPAVQFFAQAMGNKKIVKGALCHGLWILTPRPELLKGRKVICHAVVMADVINAGAQYTWSHDKVVVDDDLVTGFSWHEVVPYIEVISKQILRLNPKA